MQTHYVRRDGRQHHQTGCSDISVGAMTEQKAVQQRIRYCMRVWPERTVTVWYCCIYACICVTTCISSAWRSCIWLSTIQTTTLTSRWRSYLNHFGDQVQFWHPHWIHLVHVCSDNLFSLFATDPVVPHLRECLWLLLYSLICVFWASNCSRASFWGWYKDKDNLLVHYNMLIQ